MSDYCPNCTCPSCALITRKAQLIEDRRQKLTGEKEAKEAAARQRARDSKRLFQQECAMIWMLVNTAVDQVEASMTIQRVAEALLLSPAQVNTRRSEYARLLTKRAATHDPDVLNRNVHWASIAGTPGTDLPDYCDKCGGMKTMGRKCRRCDYRRNR